jgi:hypothetical protein
VHKQIRKCALKWHKTALLFLIAFNDFIFHRVTHLATNSLAIPMILIKEQQQLAVERRKSC